MSNASANSKFISYGEKKDYLKKEMTIEDTIKMQDRLTKYYQEKRKIEDAGKLEQDKKEYSK